MPLREQVTTNSRPLRVDREKGIIYDVKILGERSANAPPRDNEYPRGTREKVIPAIEGARCYVDHGPRDDRGAAEARPYGSALGVFRGVYEAGDGLYAREFHFNPKHPLAEQLCWDAENAPEHVGFSISAHGSGERRGGRTVIDEIHFDPRTCSVDLVTRPATTNGLHESLLRSPPVKKKLKALIEELAASKERPGYLKGLREAAESGIMSDDSMMDAPADAPDESPPPAEGADHEQAIRDAAKAVIDDTSLSMKDVLDKVKKLFGAIGGNGGGEAPATEGMDGKGKEGDTDLEEEECLDDDKPPKTRESLAIATYKAIGRKGVKLTPLEEMAVKGVRTKKQARALVESLTPARPGARSSGPGSGHPPATKQQPLQEQMTGKGGELEDTPEARAARARRLRLER